MVLVKPRTLTKPPDKASQAPTRVSMHIPDLEITLEGFNVSKNHRTVIPRSKIAPSADHNPKLKLNSVTLNLRQKKAIFYQPIFNRAQH